MVNDNMAHFSPCQPNTACSGRRGFCGFEKQFSTPKHFSALKLFSTPAPIRR